MRTKDQILTQLLNNRGIISAEDRAEFLSDKPKRTYDPFLLHDMKEGVDLLLSHIRKGNRICIYGDYDADGVTSVCILSAAFRYLTDNFFYYIPSRFTEGYGMNMTAIDKIKAEGADLIITVDCGSVSCKEVEYAKSSGLEVIVTDHHTIDDVMADCLLINPKHPDSIYPFRELAGCGVAFKLVQALQRTADLPRSVLKEVLDMVAIGTVGDIVSLTDENRTIVKYGLDRINHFRRPSLAAMAERASIKFISSENIAFAIVPRINAAGRMESATEAVKLFTSDNRAEIETRVEKLENYNRERKELQEKAYEKCVHQITGDEPFIILNIEGIHEGIAGIVAGNIKEHYNRPAVITTPSGDGFLKGTGRSIEGVNLYDVLNGCSELFERFGGHKGACGFLIKEENFDALKEHVTAAVMEILEDNPELFEKVNSYELELSPAEINVDLAKSLLCLEPFGEGNPSPVFCMKNVEIQGVTFMGDKRNHAKFEAESDNYLTECVLFKKAIEYEDMLFCGIPVDITGRLSYQVWHGREKCQFIVEEIMYHEDE